MSRRTVTTIPGVARAHRGRTLALSVVGALVVGAVVGWSAEAVFRSPATEAAAPDVQYATAAQGSVESALPLEVVAQWSTTPLGTNRATGTVTAVSVRRGDTVRAGDTLYLVDERPVVIATGKVPAFRELRSGLHGRDVAQLERLLDRLGYLHRTPDDTFDSATATAVRAWQRDLGVGDDGIVRVGDVVFVDHLPAKIALDTERVKVGAGLAGGEDVVGGLKAAPAFTTDVTDRQSQSLTPGTNVTITPPKGVNATWHAVVGSARSSNGTTTLTLVGKGGTPVCGTTCGAIPVSGATALDGEAPIVPRTSGLVVPAGSVVADAEGRSVVVTQAGERVPVTVVATAKGMCVVTGVEAGTQVRVDGETAPTDASTQDTP
ncbi:hypothetical protein GCM10023221_00190 [Luteimicrobium xylanilyticum]|uniref:Peptidoglycan binding-like domain-containing protein n=1 Tax=Luteimicrobium xylanilyticum TaxID=1133546 RepID=A0A5P9Q8B9_9MICO|nr:peptidoglycan-binding domain-containing protein [Luteimicrobium xylanilyticum]QFU97683.1 hypothetical protein KDY119_01182 [Luteimicrobium xylanilyticum]